MKKSILIGVFIAASILCSWFILLNLGCRKQSNESLTADQNIKLKQVLFTPYERCRSGAAQLAGALELIEEAHRLLKNNKKQIIKVDSNVFEELSDAIDSAGTALGDYVSEPPEEKSLQSKSYDYQAICKKAIVAANDAYHDLSQADTIVENLLQAMEPAMRAELDKLGNIIDEATDALEEAVKVMDGKIESL